jgi:L-lactate permease
MTHLPVIRPPVVLLPVVRLLLEKQAQVEEQAQVEVVQPLNKKNQAEVTQANLHYQMVNAYLLLFLLLFLQNLEEERTVVFLQIFQTSVNLLVKVAQPLNKKQVETIKAKMTQVFLVRVQALETEMEMEMRMKIKEAHLNQTQMEYVLLDT